MKSRNTHESAKPQRRTKSRLRHLGLVTMVAALPAVLSCKSEPEKPAVKEWTVFEAPQDDLSKIQYNPTFEPDYNRLTPQPWVEPVTTAQQDAADVYPDRLEFPESMIEVLDWAAGRVVVGAPSEGTGKNAMGFARRVVSVMQVSPKIVVKTTSVAIEDLFQGDVQLQFKPDTAKPMDLTKVDLDWAANNLYFNDSGTIDMPGEPLTGNSPGGTKLGFWNKIAKAVTSAAKAVAKVAKDVYLAITPATVSGSVSLTKTLGVKSEAPLFQDLKYSKEFTTKGGVGAELSIKGSGKYSAGLEFSPGLQFGAKIAVPGHNANSLYWMNVDSMLTAKLGLAVDLEAALEALGGQSGPPLQDQLNQISDKAQDALNSYREQLFGNEDVKPASSWKKTLFVSKPGVLTFFAGPVPVVVTATFQIDFECGFEAKANMKAEVEVEQSATFKFKVMHDRGTKKTTIEGPKFGTARKFHAQVLGSGEVTVSCGLIPRVNVLLYDTVGLFAGIRASAVARAQYEAECPKDPNAFRSEDKITLGLYANFGLQAGARAQAPGASYAGTTGAKLGYDFGPLELWNTEFKLLEKEWEFAKGLGYCTPTCKNLAHDEDEETDVDCGGECGAKCAVGRSCEKNSDCANSVCNKGTCSLDRCGDEVADALESDVDCGGPVAKCAQRCASGLNCYVGSDCASGFCGAKGTAAENICQDAHCLDGVRDSDEGGIDCGGSGCAKCADGVKVTGAVHCASGVWNGTACVATTCDDLIKSGDETSLDCGGPTCTRRCGLKLGCAVSADCATGFACHSGLGVCLRVSGAACIGGGECLSGTCTANVCEALAPTCQAIVQAKPASADGSYKLYVGGDITKPWTAYCKDMATAPKEYLTLVNTTNANFSQYSTNGRLAGSNVRTYYQKIRINPTTLSVDTADQTYSTSSGQVNRGAPVKSMPYGTAADCEAPNSSLGVGNVDLTGTPFVVAPNQFVVGGFLPAGKTTYGPSGRTVDIKGGGYCGWNAPVTAYDPQNNIQTGPIQLQYLP